MTDSVVSQLLSLLPVALGISLGLAFVALTTWRPLAGCAAFALSIPLTTGLGRGTIVPLLRPNEAILLALVAGLALHRLRHPQRRALTALDLAMWIFAVGSVVIPVLVLIANGASSVLHDFDTLRTVLQPIQFLLVYLLFSRTEFTGRGLQTILNLTMVASIPVGVLAVAELAVPSVRDIAEAYFPPPPVAVGWDPLYRPTSTLGHYSAVAAFASLNYTLALALATVRHPAFSRAWLSLVMTVNVGALVASLTWAPLLVLPLVTGIVLWRGRRIPPELGATILALSVAFILFWPSVSARSAQQGVSSSVGGVAVPQTFAFRMRHWEEFFIPALADHVWLGTGTVLPSEVPESLTKFVDNEYLREGFRAGILGLTLLAIMLGTIAVAGWQCRASPDATRRALGATALALVVFFALVGFTGEYLFFGGVSQEFAMLIGLLGLTRTAEAPAAFFSRAAVSHRLAAAQASPL